MKAVLKHLSMDNCKMMKGSNFSTGPVNYKGYIFFVFR